MPFVFLGMVSAMIMGYLLKKSGLNFDLETLLAHFRTA